MLRAYLSAILMRIVFLFVSRRRALRIMCALYAYDPFCFFDSVILLQFDKQRSIQRVQKLVKKLVIIGSEKLIKKISDEQLKVVLDSIDNRVLELYQRAVLKQR